MAYHLFREHADVDLVVDAAVGLEDHVSSGLHELVGAVAQEEVAQQHLLALLQSLLRSVEVERDVESLQELRQSRRGPTQTEPNRTRTSTVHQAQENTVK